MEQIQLWGGVECTINRVGNRYFNQLERSGHWQRADNDLARFAELGLRTLRFPILWETVAPRSLDEFEWSWPDGRLAQLKQLGIRPIVGLLHHGSGPRYTNLLDPEFALKLARFAAAVAQRYPWVDAYTPVNEPLTTARFSGLYGHWYPHGHDDATFVRALLNQCRGTALAMEAIRKVNSRAILVQTDDLGRTFSTPELHYQAVFGNERRWLSWDLLRGSVQRDHPMWAYLIESAAQPHELDALADDPCSADIIGINHYVTSDRFLDENLNNYPTATHGRNRWQSYADDEAVRAHTHISGFEGAVREAFARYQTPIALTEVHLGCTPDERLRWFMEAWDAARSVRAQGIDVCALTAWALLGSFGWDSLVTQQHDHYEAGVFEIRDGELHSTLLADALAKLTRGERIDHPVLNSRGWWRRHSRLRASVARSPQFAIAR